MGEIEEGLTRQTIFWQRLEDSLLLSVDGRLLKVSPESALALGEVLYQYAESQLENVEIEHRMNKAPKYFENK